MRERDWYWRPDWYLPRDWHFHWEDKTGVGDLELKGFVVEAAYDRAFQSGWKERVWYKPWTWNNWVKQLDFDYML